MPSASHPQHSSRGPHSLRPYSFELISELWLLKEHLPRKPDERTGSSHPLNVFPRLACASLRYRCERTHLPSDTSPGLLRDKVASGESSPRGPPAPSLRPGPWGGLGTSDWAGLCVGQLNEILGNTEGDRSKACWVERKSCRIRQNQFDPSVALSKQLHFAGTL